jgi:hypothetical protein
MIVLRFVFDKLHPRIGDGVVQFFDGRKSVLSTTHRLALRRLRPHLSSFSSPIRRMCVTYPTKLITLDRQFLPDALKKATPHPGLKPMVNAAVVAEFQGETIPLTTGPQAENHTFKNTMEVNFLRRLSRQNWADRRTLLAPLLERLSTAFAEMAGDDDEEEPSLFII